MPAVTVIYGEKTQTIQVSPGSLLGDAIAATGLPLEQPCAGRGTCGKCKVLVELGVADPDEIERQHLTPGELALNQRLACRARLYEDARIVLSPVVVYSNKNFRSSSRYKRIQCPLGLAIDLGSTTVAAFLTILEDGEVCAGAASLNQQSVYGADVISRLQAAQSDPAHAERLHRLALTSINQAVDALKLSASVRKRIQKVTVVGNVAMHHLLARLPVHTLAQKPFQPLQRQAMPEVNALMSGIFSPEVQVSLPPMIGGFVGSDALACLAHFGFDRAPGPMAAIDLGTNGEVMVTDSQRILTASTAAGPAFEGVFISCGTRAVDGAIVSASFDDQQIQFETIAGLPPTGLTGSGLISLVHVLRQLDVIEPSGKIANPPPYFADQIESGVHGRRIVFSEDGRIGLTQWDIRELQKAKGAIRAAVDTLLEMLNLQPGDLQRLILTGSFGAQVDIEAVRALGMIPPAALQAIETIPNGAGLGAASFLSPAGFARAIALADHAEQIDLDQDPHFISRYINAMRLAS